MRPLSLPFAARLALLLAVPLACLSLACSGDDPAATAPGGDALQAAARGQALDTQAAPVTKGHFPLEPGWSWRYKTTFTAYPEGEDPVLLTTTLSTVSTLGEMDLGELSAWGLAEDATQEFDGETDTYHSESYYTQDRRALIEVAALNGFGGTVLPKPTPGDEAGSAGYRVGTLTFSSLEEIPRALGLLTLGFVRPDSRPAARGASLAQDGDIFLRDDPRIVLEYPLRPGRTWVSFEEPFLETREVVGHGALRVEAGNLGAVEILTRAPEIGAEFTDWIAPIGLVARHLEVDIVFPDENTTVHAVQHTELVSFERPHGARPDARGTSGLR